MGNIADILLKNNCFEADGPLPSEVADKICEIDEKVYPNSVCATGGCVYFLKKILRGRELWIVCREGMEPGRDFDGEAGEITSDGKRFMFKTCVANHRNAAALRKTHPFTAPSTLGLKTSFGMGDRLGIATPGHIRASRGYDFYPIFAQQSIREMERTKRTPENVMDDASWAVFQEGFRIPFGADADHLKDKDDIIYTTAAGFTFYTIDPSEKLNQDADEMSPDGLAEAFSKLFAADADRESFSARYIGKDITLSDDVIGISKTFTFDEELLMRTAVKYLPAVRHTIEMFKLLCEIKGGADNFDFEMSVDETDTPTTPYEHLFVALELAENKVKPQSLAPRYIGEFQKGIDYIGDEGELRESLMVHALIAKKCGPYKLSIHSGSDKFSIFPIFGELTGGLFHEKTAGTTYLEAIRVVSRRAPALYREIHKFALTRFETDRASYHVTTDLSKIPDVDSLSDDDLPGLLDKIDPRQLIHITYGSVLTEKQGDNFLFYDRIMAVLDEYEEEHYETVAAHFVNHINSLRISKLM